MKVIIFTLMFVLSYAQNINVEKSWNLLGATENLSSSFFKNDCANVVWTYKNGNWSNNTDILKGEGFWLYSANGNCTLSTESTITTSTAKQFQSDVFPIFQTNCTTSCHSSTGIAQNTRFVVTNLSSTYAATVTLVDTLNAHNSAILQKATYVIGHSGGKVFDINSTEYNTILSWISNGASNN